MDSRELAVVWIWHGVPGDYGRTVKRPIPIGSGVLIAPGFVLTAAHVIAPRDREGVEHSIDADQIWIQSLAGAFARSGGTGIAKPILAPKIDLALLPLKIEAESGAWVELPRAPVALTRDTPLEAFAYWDPGVGLAHKEAQVAAVSGKWRSLLIDADAHPGYSGGPVFCGHRLVGLVVSRQPGGDSWVMPLDANACDLVYGNSAVGQVYLGRPISGLHLAQLGEILRELDDPVPSGIAKTLLTRLFEREQPPQPRHDQTDFEACLQLLAQKQRRNESPLLVFLEACRQLADLDRRLSEEARKALDAWMGATMARARLSLEQIRAKVEEVLTPSNDTQDGLILIRIVPDLDATGGRYKLDAWAAGRDGPSTDASARRFLPLDLPHGSIGFASLTEHVKDAVRAGRDYLWARLGREVWPRIEVLVPSDLLGWDLGEVMLDEGPLPRVHEVIMRCSERHYPRLTDPRAKINAFSWKQRWELLPRSVLPRLLPSKICRVDDFDCIEDIEKRLSEDSPNPNLWTWIGEIPGREGERGWQSLLAGLRAGLPYMLWPEVEGIDSRQARDALVEWLVARDHEQWPERLLKARCTDHEAWLHLALLWDRPDRSVPLFLRGQPTE